MNPTPSAYDRMWMITLLHPRPRPGDIEAAAQDVATALLQSDRTVYHDEALRHVAYLGFALDCGYQSDPAFRVSNAYAFAVEGMERVGLVKLISAGEALVAGEQFVAEEAANPGRSRKGRRHHTFRFEEDSTAPVSGNGTHASGSTPATGRDAPAPTTSTADDQAMRILTEGPEVILDSYRVSQSDFPLVARPTATPSSEPSSDDYLILSTDALWQHVEGGKPLLPAGKRSPRRSKPATEGEWARQKKALYRSLQQLYQRLHGVQKVVAEIERPHQTDLRQLVDQELAAHPKTRGGRKRTRTDVVEAAVRGLYTQKK